MTCRISLYSDTNRIVDEFGVDAIDEEADRGLNIAPGNSISSIVEDDGGRVLQAHQWGLDGPGESPESQIVSTAGAKRLLDAPWRNMLRNGRGVVVVDNFFLFAEVDGVTTPFLYRRQDGGMIGLAAIWEAYERNDGTPGRRGVLVTTKPNALIGRIHRSSPAILLESDYGAWLSNETDELESVALLKPYPGDLRCYPVSKRMIDTAFTSPEILKPDWN